MNSTTQVKLLRRFGLTTILLLLISIVSADTVRAQNIAMNKVTIEIGRTDTGSCWYEVQDKDGVALSADASADQNQDHFVVKPNAKITFNSGTGARVHIQAQSTEAEVHPGRKGVADNESALFTISADSSVERTVRKSLGRTGKHSTNHTITISCLNEGSGDTPSDTKANLSSLDDTQMQSSHLLEEEQRGPSANAEWIPAIRVYKGKALQQGPGGPGMEVEDP